MTEGDVKVLDKVRKLLDRANHAGTGEHERNACISKADQLMLQHSIDQAMLDATKTPTERRKPVHRKFRAWENLVWRTKFQTIMTEICNTMGVRANVSFSGDVDMVGMSDDVDYCELLWTQTYFAFLANLEPRWDNNLSFEHNVYNFKNAGNKWSKICSIARDNGQWVDWPDGGRLIRAYKRHCAILGETPTNHTQRHDVYRESFAESFTNTVCARLEDQRRDRKEAAKEQGASLVLYDMSQEVEGMYFDIFPDKHPDAVAKRRKDAMEKYNQIQENRAQERKDMLDAMTPKQREQFLEKEARQQRRDAAANERYWQRQANASHDTDGHRAGRKAGNSVDLSRKAGAVSDNSRGELG